MDPIATFKKLKHAANGSVTETGKKIDLEADFSGGKGLCEALADLLIPFSTSGVERSVIGRSWSNQKCSLCSQDVAWDKLLATLSGEEKEAAQKELKENRIPAAALLKLATPAPFGKGKETVLDTDVRKAFEIPASSLPEELFPSETPLHRGIAKKIAATMKPSNVTWKYK